MNGIPSHINWPHVESWTRWRRAHPCQQQVQLVLKLPIHLNESNFASNCFYLSLSPSNCLYFAQSSFKGPRLHSKQDWCWHVLFRLGMQTEFIRLLRLAKASSAFQVVFVGPKNTSKLHNSQKSSSWEGWSLLMLNLENSEHHVYASVAKAYKLCGCSKGTARQLRQVQAWIACEFCLSFVTVR